MTVYAADTESFPNFFCVTFLDIDSDTKKVFVIHNSRNDFSKLVDFLNSDDCECLISYNGISYDNPVLWFLMNYKGLNQGEAIAREVNLLSNKLISDDFRNDRSIVSLRYPKFGKTWQTSGRKWTHIDCMTILAADKLGISLKQISINLMHEKIQDLPLPHNHFVVDVEVDMILDYNLNDVKITKKLYWAIKNLIDLRRDLSAMYGLDLLSASDSKIANLLLEKIYVEKTGVDIRDIREKRTHREKVFLGDCIAKYVRFETPALQELYDRVSSMYVYEYNNYSYKEKISFANCMFQLGIGGIHTDDEPGIFLSTEEYEIVDADVASFYPNLIINNNFYPQHLGEEFIQIMKEITADRIAAKRAGNKVKADAGKIVVNSMFGKLGSNTFWLYDPKQMLSVTVSGQLSLLMLIEKLYSAGIQPISANTDGVTSKVPVNKKAEYERICKEWEKATNLELEFTLYKKYVRRDVNSYVTIKADGKTKEKGAFLKDVDIKKAYHAPIVARSLYNYFVKGISVRQTLEESKNIMDFCISQKSADTFQIELHTIKGVERLQKTNRFFITKDGGSLIKRDKGTGRTTGLYVGRLVKILNDYDKNVPFDDYKVDLLFYEAEVYKTIDEIEPKQMSMFDMSAIERGSKTKMQAPGAAPAPVVDMTDYKLLNKLGKNQFKDQIASLVKGGQKIDKISSLYTYVISYDGRKQFAELYCLRKGSKAVVKVDKGAMKFAGLKEGDVIFCQGFRKTQDGHTLTGYSHVVNFTREEEKLM